MSAVEPTVPIDAARVNLFLTRDERDLIRERLDYYLSPGDMCGPGINGVREWRPVLEWALPLLDRIGWTAGDGPRLDALEVTLPGDSFGAFLREAHTLMSEYVDDCRANIERAQEHADEYHEGDMTPERYIAQEEGIIRQARGELAHLEALLGQVEPAPKAAVPA